MHASMADKAACRREFLAVRRRLEGKAEKSAQICRRVMQTAAFQAAKTIALYHSLPDEADTADLIAAALREGKTVALPRVEGDRLQFYRIASADAALEISPFGVAEPPAQPENAAPADTLDLVIVPGVCFDLRRNRMGYGKGFYDRFLRETPRPTIAVCFAAQVLRQGTLPVTPADVPMDLILTEAETI